MLLIDGARDTIVARVMDYVPRGEFTSFMGEKWLNEIAAQGAIDAVGSDIKKSKISYKVRIKILGALDRNAIFAPGLKRIPHITSKVSIPDKSKLENIISKALEEQSAGANIGYYHLNKEIGIKFDMRELSSKRTFVFARAGYGKSNLMKIIGSEWKKENGGLLVFDPEGEYAVTDKKDRPGIMDKRGAIFITNRKVDPNLKNVYPIPRLNLAELNHKLVIPLIVNETKHTNIFFLRLMSMNYQSWPELVALLYRDGWGADFERVKQLVLGNTNRDARDDEMSPILNNLVPPIRSIHDPQSNLISIIEKALAEGRIIIFDISQMDSRSALLVSSIIVKQIFLRNKDNFISQGEGGLTKATFVMEEAHTVLSNPDSATSAFVDLAKEGRKYNLGGIFITQQPGSIPPEIISQGDNFFIFHLLSKGDLRALSNANAHYSDDIITQILNEPIRGKCYMWTSHQPFVIPVDIMNFEDKQFCQPHQSVAVQEKDNILAPIISDIVNKQANPQFKSIFDKFLKIEKENSGKEIKYRTVPLFRSLNEDEKKYLDSEGGIQRNESDEAFAVTIKYYQSLLRYKGILSQDVNV